MRKHGNCQLILVVIMKAAECNTKIAENQKPRALMVVRTLVEKAFPCGTICKKIETMKADRRTTPKPKMIHSLALSPKVDIHIQRRRAVAVCECALPVSVGKSWWAENTRHFGRRHAESQRERALEGVNFEYHMQVAPNKLNRNDPIKKPSV